MSTLRIKYLCSTLKKENTYLFDLFVWFFCLFIAYCTNYQVPSHIFSSAIHENESVYHSCIIFLLEYFLKKVMHFCLGSLNREQSLFQAQLDAKHHSSVVIIMQIFISHQQSVDFLAWQLIFFTINCLINMHPLI